jgi:hypothetical protein
MRAVRLRSALLASLTSAAVLIGSGVASAAPGSAVGAGTAGSVPGSVRWTSVHAGDGHAVAADPRGGLVFVVASTTLVAYNSGTGAKVWDNSKGFGRAVAVSPDGHSVFVIRSIRPSGGTWDFSTAAFDATTGKRLWASRYNGRANGVDIPAALAVSPRGGTVFVTGTSPGTSSGRDYATVAYRATTGKQLWVSRYNGRRNRADTPVAITVSSRGAVFVTGTSLGRNSGLDYATVGYAAATGASLWTKRFNNGLDAASSVAASQDGHRVFVTGSSATIAYAAATGAPLWVRPYDLPGIRESSPVSVLVSPRGGGTVVISGDSRGQTARDYVSVAYSAVTGRTKWVSRFHGGFSVEILHAAALSPDGGTFYLTGSAAVQAGGEEPAVAFTVAAKIATGAESWAKAADTGSIDAIGRSVAVNPDGGTVYIVLEDFNPVAQDFATVAFRA